MEPVAKVTVPLPPPGGLTRNTAARLLIDSCGTGFGLASTVYVCGSSCCPSADWSDKCAAVWRLCGYFVEILWLCGLLISYALARLPDVWMGQFNSAMVTAVLLSTDVMGGERVASVEHSPCAKGA